MKRLFWHLLSNRWNSAITEYAISAARATQTLGHDISFFPLTGSPAERRTVNQMPTLSLSDFGLGQAPRLIALARRQRPEAIFSYGGPETVLATLVARSIGCRLIRFRGQSSTRFGPLNKWRQRLSLAGVDVILTPSELITRETARFGLTQPIVTLPLGCDVKKFHRSPSGCGLGARPEMLIFGRFDPVKGHAEMIRWMPSIFEKWPQHSPRPRLHICGEPANVTVHSLEAEARQVGLELGDDVVITSERVANVAALLSRATLGVVPSLGSEIICRVAQEFLLCGTPVAVSGAGSLPEVIFPGAGFSFGGLTKEVATTKFIEWMQLSNSEIEPAKEDRSLRASKLYSLESMAENLSDLLNSLVKK